MIVQKSWRYNVRRDEPVNHGTYNEDQNTTTGGNGSTGKVTKGSRFHVFK